MKLGNEMKLSKVAVLIALSFTGSVSPWQAIADEASIERIVVTGQKIDRSIQETKSSVAVITAKDIENQSVRDISDIFDTIPNVHGSLNYGFSIRGIDAFNVSGSGTSFLTSMYLDGAPLPHRIMQQGAISMWDISQVEVFRGPQSTIQGRNSLAGAVVMRSTDPTYEPSAKFQVVMGENGQQEFAFAGGGTLIEDQVAVRFSAETKDFDGYNYNTTREEGSDFRNSENYRAKILFEPKALQGFSGILAYTHNENELGPTWSNTASAEGSRNVAFNAPMQEVATTDIYTLELTYELNNNWDLDSITTYNEVDYRSVWDGDFSAAEQSELSVDRLEETFSQELKLIFDYSKLKGVVGLYYSDLNVNESANGQRTFTLDYLGVPTLLVAPTELGGLGLPQPLADQVLGLYAPVDPVQLGSISSLTQSVESMALFADLTYEIDDSWELIAGLRYDREKQANGSSQLVNIDNADLFPDPALYGQTNPLLGQLLAGLNQTLFAQATDASATAAVVDEDFTAFLPKIGATYKVNDDISISAIYQKAYRSGGVGTNIARASIYTYGAEYTDNYELSLRSVWLDGSLVLNGNLFYLDWEEQQVSAQLSGNQFDTETVNAGLSNVKGFETEVFYYPTPELTITAGFGYAKSEFDSFRFPVAGQIKDFSGKSFEDAPETTANLAVNYKFDYGFYINANINYTGNSPAFLDPSVTLPGFDPAVDPMPINDSRTLVNMQLGYEFDNYKAFLTVRNVFDEEYIDLYRNENTPEMNLGEPRQVSLTLQANF